jgi:hypothetical protein
VIPTAATAVATDSDSSVISESSDTVVADQTDRLDSSFEWFIEEVGMGTKPAIVLAPDGTPHIGFMLEAIDGDDSIGISYVIQTGGSEVVVKYASNSANSKSWTIIEFDTLGEVFYGFEGAREIMSIQIESAGNLWIVYSDQANIKLAVSDGDAFVIETISTSDDCGEKFGQLVSRSLDQHEVCAHRNVRSYCKGPVKRQHFLLPRYC